MAGILGKREDEPRGLFAQRAIEIEQIMRFNDFVERVRKNAKPVQAGPQKPVPAILGVRG